MVDPFLCQDRYGSSTLHDGSVTFDFRRQASGRRKAATVHDVDGKVQIRQGEEVSCWVDAQKLCEPRPDVGAGADEGRTVCRGSGYERKVEAATEGVLEGEAIASKREATFHWFDVPEAATRSKRVEPRLEISERNVCGTAAGNDGGGSFRGAATHLGVGGGIGGVSSK
jgi:hypothetical protein